MTCSFLHFTDIPWPHVTWLQVTVVQLKLPYIFCTQWTLEVRMCVLSVSSLFGHKETILCLYKCNSSQEKKSQEQPSASSGRALDCTHIWIACIPPKRTEVLFSFFRSLVCRGKCRIIVAIAPTLWIPSSRSDAIVSLSLTACRKLKLCFYWPASLMWRNMSGTTQQK